MDAKQLRIGNIVGRGYMNPSPTGSKKQYDPCDIKSLGIEKVIVNEKLYSKSLIKMDYSNLKPIPLTEEWLLKFGAEKISHFTVSNSIILKLKRNLQLSFGNVGTPNFMVFIQEVDGKYISDLMCIHNFDYEKQMYVHQLQNLYFALTGEELTLKQ